MNPSTALATVLVDELLRGGVTDVVLCPGSRSAPLAYAALEAETSGRLRLHVRVDERSAGFLALGLSAGSSNRAAAGSLERPVVGSPGRPVAVITTSGTAVANLHPAVLEAHHAGVPVVVLSADRPHEMRGAGANQTTRQPGLFGPSTRFDADLPAPERRAGQHDWWRATVCRALAAATGADGGPPGPAHLNVCFREPLVPDHTLAPANHAEPWPEPLDGRPEQARWTEIARGPTATAAPGDDRGAPPIAHVERTVVVLGATEGAARAKEAAAWAAARGYPFIAEPLGSLDTRVGALPHGPLALTATAWLDAHLPERVVVIGRPTLSRAVTALLKRPEIRVEHVVIGPGWPDPTHRSARVHSWPALLADLTADGAPDLAPDVSADLTPGRTPERTPGDASDCAAGPTPSHGPTPPLGPTPPHQPTAPGDFAAAWADAGRQLADAVAAQGFPWPSGLAVAAVVAGALPSGAALMLGSSNVVRDVDLALSGAPGTAGQSAVDVFANRGLAGIDGLVSTAVGIALARRSPTWALVGDLTFLHDANGVLIGPGEPRPDLTVVVVNDDGGGIFTTLEPGEPERAASFERLFGTATGTDLAALCRAHGIRHDLAGSRGELAALVAEVPHDIRVVEVRVDRSTHRRIQHDLRALAARTLAAPAGVDQ